MSQKNNSQDSYTGHHGRKYRTSTSTREDMERNNSKQTIPAVELQNLQAAHNLESPIYLSVHVGNPTQTTFMKFLQFFQCIAKKTLDDSKRLSSYCSSPVKEQEVIDIEKTDESTEKEIVERCNEIHKPCISNSSLKDIETGAIEDELTTYMKEIRRREYYS
nr:uncharacterized protein LOC111512097 [Leptinotarsa decemlineata]